MKRRRPLVRQEVRTRRLSQLMVFALAVWAPAAQGATIHVPAEQPTIQQGLDAASEGDTVLVAAGTYAGAGNRELDFGGVNLVLLSEGGPANTTIDCEGAGRGFFFHSGEDTTALVEGFTIQNAAADTGAGAMCGNGSSPRFQQCTFRRNAATTYGGGVCCSGSSPIFRFCLFEENDVSGGSVPMGGALACLADAGPALRGCTFTGNAAPEHGGAAYSRHSAPRFSHCSFSDNTCLWGGGGMYCSVSSSPTVTDCSFTANTGSQGSAIYTQNSSATVTGCTFSEHGSRAVCFLYTSTGHVSHCTFVNNGSHFHCYDNANAVLSNCTLVGSSSTAGAITMDGASPTIENCIIAFSTGGPAAGCYTGANPTFSRCVLFSNAGGNDLCGTVSDTLHRDPRFCGVVGGDYTLCQNSVCAPDGNVWTELIGALDVGCGDCLSVVEPATWGAIKALYYR